MARIETPKSILKKPSHPTRTLQSKEERDRETALYHAHLLQYRKDLELQILLSTEELIDLPLVRGPEITSSSPSPADVKLFKKGLQCFQPSDYDALILERNINEHCGYVLCPKPRVKEAKGKYRLVGKSGRAQDFRIIEKEELEKWCSEDCARRALYVRVQLSECPAWERGTSAAEIELLDEHKSNEQRREETLAKDLRALELGTKQDKENLALERGDTSAGSLDGLVGVGIREKDITQPATAPSFDVDHLDNELGDMHLSLDGHTPKFWKSTAQPASQNWDN
ncbi:MAG: hypothetical protein M1818_004318 [Claussenomyces sp. TS43310]|nr:MAG: hypothetical protein M1818_004318 [Claussenomyces sp. TS43310]